MWDSILLHLSTLISFTNSVISLELFAGCFCGYIVYGVLMWTGKIDSVLSDFRKDVLDNDQKLAKKVQIVSYILLGTTCFMTSLIAFLKSDNLLILINSASFRYIWSVLLILNILAIFLLHVTIYNRDSSEKEARLAAKIIWLTPLLSFFIGIILFSVSLLLKLILFRVSSLLKLIIAKRFEIMIALLVFTAFIMFRAKYSPKSMSGRLCRYIYNMLFPVRAAKKAILPFLQEKGFLEKKEIQSMLKRRNIRLTDDKFARVMKSLEKKGLVTQASSNNQAWKYPLEDENQ